MRLPLLALAAVATFVAPAVQAQDFLGGLVRGAARSAAQGAVNGAVERGVDSLTRPRAAAPARPAPEARAGEVQAEPRAAPSGLAPGLPAPVPVRYAASMRTPGEMAFSQADEDAKTALRLFGRVDCSSCEGGYDFETWVKHQVPAMWGTNVLGNHLGAMAVGQSLTWTGRTSRGQYTITVVDTQSVGRWECKQLRWSGRRGDRTAEAPGLICKVGDNWHEVF